MSSGGCPVSSLGFKGFLSCFEVVSGFRVVALTVLGGFACRVQSTRSCNIPEASTRTLASRTWDLGGSMRAFFGVYKDFGFA